MERKNQYPNRKRNNQDESQGKSSLNDYLKYAGMGAQMLAIIAIFTWAGIKLDKRSGNEKQLFTAILSLLGVIIAIYTVLKDFIHKDEQE